MPDIRSYLLAICGAAILCSIAKRFLPKEGAPAAIGKLVIGLFLVITVLAPTRSLKIDDFTLISDIKLDADSATQLGQTKAKNEIKTLIKQRTESYILRKASSFKAELTVEVTVSDDEIPIPIAVRLKGAVAPYAKQQLQQMLVQELGISKENQQWT